ncbi:MAG: F0F1 ATP synthase subunit A [Ruminococcus sp.]|nr:F0F1 ATP synthase subunit A [Ruminococcus sp.]
MDGIGQGPRVAFTIPIFGGIEITETIVIGWLIIVAVFLLCRFLTRNLEKVPTKKRQIIAEMFVGFVNNTVITTMGKKWKHYAPYIATLLVYAVLGALVSLLGLRSMTADFNVPLTWALMTFVLITYYKIKSGGVLGYLKGYASPVFVMLPLNILSEIATPLSMAFRMFGNISGGAVITALIYGALGALSRLCHLAFEFGGLGLNIMQLFIPAVLSIYFDLFSGCIQAYIFATLTMVYVSSAAEEEPETSN